MAESEYYRGGDGLIPQSKDVRIDRVTGLVMPRRGVSVSTRTDGLERFGAPHRVTQLPDELVIVQRGCDPDHYEIVPRQPMSFEYYEALLQKIVLVPIEE